MTITHRRSLLIAFTTSLATHNHAWQFLTVALAWLHQGLTTTTYVIHNLPSVTRDNRHLWLRCSWQQSHATVPFIIRDCNIRHPQLQSSTTTRCPRPMSPATKTISHKISIAHRRPQLQNMSPATHVARDHHHSQLPVARDCCHPQLTSLATNVVIDRCPQLTSLAITRCPQLTITRNKRYTWPTSATYIVHDRCPQLTVLQQTLPAIIVHFQHRFLTYCAFISTRQESR